MPNFEKFFAAVAARQSVPFRWGRFDCCTAANSLLWAAHRISLMAGLPRYSSMKGALRLVKGAGHDSLADLITARALAASMVKTPPARAKRGDLLLLPWLEAEHSMLAAAPGVVVGSTALYAGERGWTHVPVSEASAAFTVLHR